MTERTPDHEQALVPVDSVGGPVGYELLGEEGLIDRSSRRSPLIYTPDT